MKHLMTKFVLAACTLGMLYSGRMLVANGADDFICTCSTDHWCETQLGTGATCQTVDNESEPLCRQNGENNGLCYGTPE